MQALITVLPGDGIGPEVAAAGRAVLERIADRHGHRFEFSEQLIGGAAIDAVGEPLPDGTVASCKDSYAVLLGAVGGPKWSDPNAAVRPEQGLLGLRSVLGVFANLRPVKIYPELAGASPLRPEILEGVDIIVVRELTGGIYFGQPKGRQGSGPSEKAFDTMVYTRQEIERIAEMAFKLARLRSSRVTSVDKANVLTTMVLWREVVNETAGDGLMVLYLNDDNQLRWESSSGTVSMQPARSFWQRFSDFFWRLMPIEGQL